LSHAPFDAPFAHGIYKQKYAQQGEEWQDTAFRVVEHVMGAVDMADTVEAGILASLIDARKFIPGGRYLYASGRDLHQVQNCLLLRAEDTREGWSQLVSDSTMALMTGAGIGVWYGDVRCSGSVITRTGGTASGPISLMKMVNEVGRNVMQGGARRSAIWAGLPWWHPDVFEFIRSKDWSQDVRALKEKDFTFPADLDMTNISVTLDKDFFDAYNDETSFVSVRSTLDAPDGRSWNEWAREVYELVVDKMLTTAEPGFSVDYDNASENLRNAPVTGETQVLTDRGYRAVRSIVGKPTSVWTGKQWASGVVFEQTKADAEVVRVEISGGRFVRCDPEHEFLVERRVVGQPTSIGRVGAGALVVGDTLHVALPVGEAATDQDDYELGYIYGDGSFAKAGGAEVTFCTDESKACAASFAGHASMNMHDSRGHIRAYYSVNRRFAGRSKDKFPDDVGCLNSFLAGLFDADGNYELIQRRVRLSSKHRSFLAGAARALESLGILAGVSKAGTSTYGKAQGWQLVVNRDFNDEFARLIPCLRLRVPARSGKGYRPAALKVLAVAPDGREDVFCADVGVPEHSFVAEGVVLSNCTEITSEDDSDVCNLGSLNMAAFTSLEEFRQAVDLATLFLVAGTVYSDLPYDKVHATREKNRRLGLGIMGVHEWLLKRGKKYGPDDELAKWLEVYATSTEYAHKWADAVGVSRPIKTRAIAPNGTIGIIAETTTSAEPIFASAFKRRVRNASAQGDTVQYEYVVDPTAARLVADGVDPAIIEDAYSLSYDVERRVAFQHWLQQYVDHGISSTVNLPRVIDDPAEQREFGEMLMKYLPGLRGITAYPDGSRGGQPLTAVPIEFALDKTGVRFEEAEDRCVGGLCGV